MIDRKQRMLATAGKVDRWKIDHGLKRPETDYLADDVADLLKNRLQMCFGQTVKLPELKIYYFGPNEEYGGFNDIVLADKTGRLEARVFPENHNYQMGKPLGETILAAAKEGIIHFPVFACGSSRVYTALTEEYPFYLVGFVGPESERPSRRAVFELTPVKRFGDWDSGGL